MYKHTFNAQYFGSLFWPLRPISIAKPAIDTIALYEGGPNVPIPYMYVKMSHKSLFGIPIQSHI